MIALTTSKTARPAPLPAPVPHPVDNGHARWGRFFIVRHHGSCLSRTQLSAHASTTPRGAPDTGTQAGAARNPLPGMATGRYFHRMTRPGDAMANDDKPARVRVPVREERRGFWGEWGWTIISVIARTILRGIFHRG